MLEAYKESWLRTFETKTRMQKDVYGRAMLMHFLFTFVPMMVLVILEIENFITVIFTIYFLFSLFPVISCTIQRCHDIGKSGWYILLYYVLSIFIVGVGLLILNLQNDSQPCDNKWGPYTAPINYEQGFVDTLVTEQDLKADRKKLVKVLLKIFRIFIIIILICGFFVWLDL